MWQRSGNYPQSLLVNGLADKTEKPMAKYQFICGYMCVRVYVGL